MTKTGYAIAFAWITMLTIGSYFALLAGHDAWGSLSLSLAKKEMASPLSIEASLTGILPQADRDRLTGGLDSLAETLKRYQEQLLKN